MSAQTLAQVQPVVQPVVEIKECPICLDDIQGLKNCVTTDCGHTFHCRCLMTNIAHNGFACPFCRSELADVAEDDEDSDAPARYEDDTDDDEFSDDGDDDASRASDYDSEQDDLDGELQYIENQIVQMKEDHVLRGFRWLFQPLNADEDVNLEDEAPAEAEEVVNLEDAPVEEVVEEVVNLDAGVVNLDAGVVNLDAGEVVEEVVNLDATDVNLENDVLEALVIFLEAEDSEEESDDDSVWTDFSSEADDSDYSDADDSDADDSDADDSDADDINFPQFSSYP